MSRGTALMHRGRAGWPRRWGRRGPGSERPLDPPQHGHDLAEDARLVPEDRGVSRVVRDQPHMPVALLERLDRRGALSPLALDHCRDDLAVLRVRLLPDDDPVAVGDGGVDHRVTGNLEKEVRSLADELLRQREDVLDLLLGKDRATSGDAADQRHVRGLLRGYVDRALRHLRAFLFLGVYVRTDRRVAG